jgi:hypothetical protein
MTLRSAIADLISPEALRSGLLGPRHPEFELATRQSQLLRVTILLSLAPFLLAIVIGRFLLTRQWEGFIEMLILIAVMMTYEVCVFVAVRRAVSRDQSLPLWFWQVNAVIECFFPTLAILLLSGSGVIPPHRAIILPWVISYSIFMVLSILSLRPSISITAGITSSLGYALLLIHSHMAFERPIDDPLPPNVLVMGVLNIMFVGVSAAWVAWRIRRHAMAEIIESARRQTIEQDLEVAGRIQQGLLPQAPPMLHGFEVAAWNRPAVHAGGDFYDWITLPDGRVALVLADVSGHGLGPALLAALCRSYLRAALAQHEDLGQALNLVNSLLSEDLPDGWFITTVVAVLNAEEGSVQLISAGHGPNLLFHALDSRFDAFPADAPPLGVLKALPLGVGRRFKLEVGDLLVLVSDGFHEWPAADGQRFGIERLQKSISESREDSPTLLIQRMLHDVEGFVQASPQPDDLSAIVLKRTNLNAV